MSHKEAKDITVVYITANKISDYFAENVRKHLLATIRNIPLISVSKKPLDFGTNICMPGEYSIINLYKQSYAGVKAAKTKRIAIVEDDCLYSYEHFRFVPKEGHFAYNVSTWGIYTWIDPPQYNWKGRKTHNALICERDLYLQEMDERNAKYPDESKIPKNAWAEPGRYEKNLGITVYPTQEFVAHPPIIKFSHEQENLTWKQYGNTKRMGALRAFDIPFWGSAKLLLEKIYGKSI